MLQPRIAIRQLRQTYSRLLSPLVSRHYVTVIETPSTSTASPDVSLNPFDENVEPPPMRDASMTGQSALRRYTPRTPGIRHLVRPINDHLYKGRPIFKLTFPKKGQSRGGRNFTGHVTVRHRGGGHKRRIRIVDFNRFEDGQHLVERIEHDPGRSAHIALVTNKKTGAKSYIIAAEGLRAGDTVQSYRAGIPEDLMKAMGGSIDQGVLASKTAWRGNCLPLGMIPLGTPIFNITLAKEGKAMYCRSAGTHGFIIGKGEDAVQKELIKQMEAKRVKEQARVVDKAKQDKAAEQAADEAREAAAKKAAEKGTADDADDAAKEMEEQFLNKAEADTEVSAKEAENEDEIEIYDGELKLSNEDIRKLEKAAQYVTVRLSSGEVRLIDKEAAATVGVASNGNHQYRQLGKAGRSRWLGIRPTVRGLAMNANEHPHGGGRGKGKGNRDPCSPWGRPVCPSFFSLLLLMVTVVGTEPLLTSGDGGDDRRNRATGPGINTRWIN
jgi:ribosomal protein L2